MFTIQKNRRACDRCHAQKLSCKREKTSGPCVRCFRAKAECYITPRLKKGKQLPTSNSDMPRLTRRRPSEGQIQSITSPCLETLSQSSDSGDERRSQDAFTTYFEDTIFSIPDVDFTGDLLNFEDEMMNIYKDDGYDESEGHGSTIEASLPMKSPGKTSSEPSSVFDFDRCRPGQEGLIDPQAFSPLEPEVSLCEEILPDASSPIYPLTPSSDTALDLAFLQGYQCHGNEKHQGAYILSPSESTRHAQSGTPICTPAATSIVEPKFADDLINKVMQLNARLYNHHRANQHPGRYDVETEEQIWRSAGIGTQLKQAKDQMSAVDETFVLSQQLLDIYSNTRASAAPLRPPSREGLSAYMPLPEYNYSSEHSHRASASQKSCTDFTKDSGNKMQTFNDSGTFLLLLSCRVRLLQIYQNLLLHLQDLLQRKSTANTFETSSHVPSLNIGAFSLRSLPNLQVSIIVELMEYFLNRLQEETPPVKLRSSAMIWSSTVSIADVTLGAIKNNELEVLQTIRRIKRRIRVV